MTEKGNVKVELSAVGRRRLELDFSAGQVSSDGGAVLLREVDLATRLTERLALCFSDHRRHELLEHTVQQLLVQRIYGLVLGYEDRGDHDLLCRDPLLASMAGKEDPEGDKRRMPKDRGRGLASASTLGRLERTKASANEDSRYDKIVCDFDALRETLVQLFVESFESAPERLVLDIDPSDVELHGQQEERFYHGYYRHHCYLPMYLFCGEFPLAVVMRPSNIDGAEGTVELLSPVVEQLRRAFPDTQVILRADSGFCRDELLTWCEEQGVDYVIGMARNRRLERATATQMEQARREYLQTGRAARRFRDFKYRTKKTWARKRRLIGKAEYLGKGANPRYVVTSLSASEFEKRYVYEVLYLWPAGRWTAASRSNSSASSGTAPAATRSAPTMSAHGSRWPRISSSSCSADSASKAPSGRGRRRARCETGCSRSAPS